VFVETAKIGHELLPFHYYVNRPRIFNVIFTGLDWTSKI